MTVVVKPEELLVSSDVFKRHARTCECSSRSDKIAYLRVCNIEIEFVVSVTRMSEI